MLLTQCLLVSYRIYIIQQKNLSLFRSISISIRQYDADLLVLSRTMEYDCSVKESYRAKENEIRPSYIADNHSNTSKLTYKNILHCWM